MSTDTCFVYMTVGSVDEARVIADALVADRLAACVNMIEGMISVYRWQGAVQRDTETVLIAKTKRERVEALIERVKALHSYDCPCIVALPIESGSSDFLTWIKEQVK